MEAAGPSAASSGEELRLVPCSGGRSVSAICLEPAAAAGQWLLFYAPGAGSNVHDPFGTYACRRLAAQGVATVRFQFPYMEARQRRPDPPGVLEATWRAMIDAFTPAGRRVVIGGRSMGGRIASQVAAHGARVDALALFAYPLHPPSDPSRWRDAHLAAVAVPTLFCSGTRDAFATAE
ncbi:MAG: dienelactone hydrolase family protein, partial [Chloroflexi bacterium]|nr:dienelactone hydrolase family protein [Chloroflexota bacterium]